MRPKAVILSLRLIIFLLQEWTAVQHDVFFLSVFLSRVLTNTGDEIQIDDLKLTGILLDDHAAVIDFLYHALHTAVV